MKSGSILNISEDLTTITSNSVITLFEDRKGTMWFGTNGGGLCSFSKETETFVDFDPENVWLPDKVIYSIEQDQAGNFWISCNSGLYQFNPINKNENRLFTINDGLQGISSRRNLHWPHRRGSCILRSERL